MTAFIFKGVFRQDADFDGMPDRLGDGRSLEQQMLCQGMDADEDGE